MSGAVAISLSDAERLAARALMRAGLAESAARSTARALVAAECDGQKGHGLSRVSSYVEQVRCGKVKKEATPVARRLSPAATLVDAAHGFAYPAIDLAIEEVAGLARRSVIAMAAIRRSHHFGQAGAHVEKLAEQGLVAFLFGNSPKAMAFWGGKAPMIGTNPVAFAAPLAEGPPLVIDLALSVAARGKVMAAKKSGEAIPADWALDADGRPTTDPAAALAGSMTPVGGAKGAALALMIEVAAAALTASNFGFEASSFLDGEGPPPDVGHVLIAIDPGPPSSGSYFSRMTRLVEAMAAEEGVRMPGATRLRNRAAAAASGLLLAPALLAELRALAGEAV
ncbi:MAG: Ldh family oxidoreductase [Parvularculaceae bacterium]